MARIRLDRDMVDGGGFAQRPVVDEQTKAAAMRAAAPAASTSQTKPDPTKTAYTDLTAAQRAAMSSTEKTDYLKAARETQMSASASARATSDPMLNPTVRPEAPQDEPGFIKYYGWVGGAGTGRWVLYKQDELSGSPDQLRSAEARSQGGKTQATFGSAVGANTLSGAGGDGGVTGGGTGGGTGSGGTGVGGTGGTRTGGTRTSGTNTVGSGNNPSPNATLVSTETDNFGNVVGFYSDGTSKTLIASGNKYKSTVDVDAYTLLENTFKDYGLDELVPEIKKFMEEGLGSNQAAVELRKTTAYINRFRGNEIRRKAGLNVVSEATYLELENSYNETLRAYGLQGYFGVDRKASQSRMADIIGNDISATEFKDRIDTVVTRVNNADPNIKATLKSFYNIEDNDLVKYFLSPKENLPKLQEKVLSAEIGNEALKQNLLTDVNTATALAQLGISKEEARKGYSGIREVLPTATKLGQIYDEEGINYTQATAEQEVFGELESAKRKRLRLAEKEVGTFSGASGLARGALSSNKSSAF